MAEQTKKLKSMADRNLNLPKVYNPKNVEDKWYQFWMEKNYFGATPHSKRKPYTIVIPPPNITDVLHMGHAYNNTIQDILIRYHRMRGFETLWLPGTDHAGIATQNVVERELLKKEGLTRHDLGREKFVERIWRWRDKYGNIIINQLKKLGSSCDWSRTRFTMDEGLSRAVTEVFVRLYEKGLIYRGKYIINWCPRCQTAISDEEVVHRDEEGTLWFIRYPLKGSGRFITVATTRPETMLGDTAVAVHPNDNRFQKVVGQTAILPIIGREIPIIADEYVDPQFGTGAVKVTPAHDPNDFEIAQRHNLPAVVVMDVDGKMSSNAGKYAGMDRFKCRKVLVEDLKAQKLLEKIKPYQLAIGHCQRCDTVVEPYLSEQWFVKIKPLAKPALKVVQEGRIKFIPEKWTKVYENWMVNIRDWCISRQLWWGHRIPVYYCDECGKMMVKASAPQKCDHCGSTRIHQDEDVLDTWFSSWLWPFSTMGWPEQTEDLAFFYPTDVLVTAPDIIFFWVARMIMAGLEFTGNIPFRYVYIHGIIRDEIGRKMSKSLGNGIDPLEMIEKYSADAVRFSLIMLTSEGQDINLAESKFEMGRNFSNKIWNAFRFLALNLDPDLIETDFDPTIEIKQNSHIELVDCWIWSRFNHTIEQTTQALENFKFNEALDGFYSFFWHDYCDWYLELIKPRLYQTDNIETKKLVLNLALRILKDSMRLLHPVMPFITEEIWQHLRKESDAQSVMIAPWPVADLQAIDETAETEMQLLQELISSVRNIRGEMNVPPARKANLFIQCTDNKTMQLLQNYQIYIQHLAAVDQIKLAKSLTKPPFSASAVVRGVELYVPLEGLIDIDKEKVRLQKEIARLEEQVKALNIKLTNPNFLEKAPPEVVEKERGKKENFVTNLEKLKKNLASLAESS